MLMGVELFVWQSRRCRTVEMILSSSDFALDTSTTDNVDIGEASASGGCVQKTTSREGELAELMSRRERRLVRLLRFVVLGGAFASEAFSGVVGAMD